SDMERIIETARKFGTKTAVCINKYDTNLQITERIEDFCERQGLDFAGKIPFDWEAVKAINMGRTIVDINCPSGNATKKIYHKTMELLYDES
ncbi:MAG: ATPase, partial [Anaerovoracaceae bacterium]